MCSTTGIIYIYITFNYDLIIQLNQLSKLSNNTNNRLIQPILGCNFEFGAKKAFQYSPTELNNSCSISLQL